MSVYISNDLYLQTLATQSAINRPIIGWHSVVRPQDISVSGLGTSGAGAEGVEAMWSPDTYTFWRSTLFHSSSESNVFINISNPQALAVNYIGIAGHNFADGGAGPLAFQMQHSSDGSTWTSTTDLAVAPSGNPVLIHFNQVQAQYHRLRISVPAMTFGQTAQVQIAHLRMGRMLRLQRKMYVGVTPFTLDKRVVRINSTSASGKYLGGRIESIHNLYAINQENNDPVWVRAHIVPFLDHAELIGSNDSYGPAGTFFAAWRPESYPNEVLYCHPPSSITRPNNQRPNGMMRWSISGEAEA